MTSDKATPTCTSIASATDRAEEVREAVGHVREIIDAYRREAVARGDRKTIAWIDRCLADVENREEKP